MKIKTTVVALFFVGNAVANEQGFYIGGKFGGESVTSDVTYQGAGFEGLGSDGLQYGTFVGYTMPLTSGAYFGVEAEYIYHSTKIKYDIGITEEMRFKHEYGGSFILGHSYSDNVNVYGRVGASRLKAEGKVSSGESGDDTVTGVLGGLGVEFKNASPLSLRAEYRYTRYSDIDFGYGVKTDNKPVSHAFSLSGVYKF